MDLAAGVALIVVVAAGWWLLRYARDVSRGDYRHPHDVGQTWWVPGGGGHGGGQVPPLIPGPDPKGRIR